MEALIDLALNGTPRAKRIFMRNFRKLPIETQEFMNRIINQLLESVETMEAIEEIPRLIH